jgi:UDP-glucose 4-epimerase
VNILITGAEGFIGRNLKEFFQAAGETVLAPPRMELDLTDDAAVADYFRQRPIEVVVHCATTRRIGTGYPPNTCENNLRMFFNLQKQLRPGQRLINLGSGSEYDRLHWYRKMPETFFDRYIPADSHSYAKYLIAKYIEERTDQELVNLRLFGIFGRYEDYRYKFISNALVKNLLGLPIVINQNVVYDYISVADFCRIVGFFVHHRAGQRTYNVTPTEPLDLLTVARLINGGSERPSEVKVLNPGIGVEYSGNNSRLMAELGAFRFTPPEEGIAELRRYYLSIREGLDAAAVRQDDYLSYARELRANFFNKT